MAEGLFFSVLNYGIEIYANTWLSATLDEQIRNSMAFSKEDNRKLQILVNKVLRVLTASNYETSTKQLHSKSHQLSVHQRCAFFSLVSVKKYLVCQQPRYHFSKFASRKDQTMRTRSMGSTGADYMLSISRCSFFYRSIRLYRLLPEDLLIMDNLKKFKCKVKDWVIRNVSLLPP